MRIILAALLLCLVSTMAQASFDRHDQRGWAQPVVSEGKVAGLKQIRKRVSKSASRKSNATVRTEPHREKSSTTVQIVAHPVGCPARSFCGCGVSVYLFGKAVVQGGLAIAAEWLRFPRADPGPGMVAARRGHVFAIVRNLGNGKVLAYDPNSGGHKTRIHVRSLAGYTVVNPGIAHYAEAG